MVGNNSCITWLDINGLTEVCALTVWLQKLFFSVTYNTIQYNTGCGTTLGVIMKGTKVNSAKPFMFLSFGTNIALHLPHSPLALYEWLNV